MNTSTTTGTATIASPCQGGLQRADDVVRGLGLPETGIEVKDPGTEKTIAHVPDADQSRITETLRSAHRAGLDWAQTTPRERSNILHRWWELLTDNAEQLALLITREMGKTLPEARGEVKYGNDFVRWYAEQAVRSGGNYQDAPDGGSRIITRRSPVGLAVLITPWNFPLAMATRKIAPALAAGCPAVIKPATATPLTAYFAVQLAREAGVPEDLVQVVTTSSSRTFSETSLRDQHTRKVSFTGSTEVGRTLLGLASERVLRTSMELGGNAPLIVFDDADVERAAEGAAAAKLRNGGQSCIAANRFYVQNGIAEEFVAAFREKMEAVSMGHGLADGVGLGPLINGDAVTEMRRLVDGAVEKGADLLCGGKAPEGPGHYFEPTVLDRVPPTAEVATTEIFGPIAAIQRFDTEDDAIERANDTEFGLSGYVFTENLDRAFRVSDRLETGLVGINQGVPSNAAAPFGGVKQSGLGREGGAAGLEEYQNIRFYNIASR
ncbi:NAD-dependent succinate-semialdehyde dehydrogenase [Kocuria sp. TGY1127_2]|uniref:NAD-dependent succinate-semialdehyde dehydrogenase n=1 Tax=Kocuria sp. TGY1127_2 TaxID=2711328 RepID=UPI0018D8507A|nr:NAD-dependent succinate-semialdehyde dehydrogenase [Kocuria sp. TGY1127_2]